MAYWPSPFNRYFKHFFTLIIPSPHPKYLSYSLAKEIFQADRSHYSDVVTTSPYQTIVIAMSTKTIHKSVCSLDVDSSKALDRRAHKKVLIKLKAYVNSFALNPDLLPKAMFNFLSLSLS